MNQEQRGKHMFVQTSLSRAIKESTGGEVDRLAFEVRENGEEFVKVLFASGSCINVCVTADSLHAILMDVGRALV